MADPRTFLLIGDFQDNITKKLESINKSLDSVKANLESLSRATKPVKTDFRQLASLSKNFSDSLKTQSSDIRDTTSALSALRKEMGRVNRAYRAGSRNRNVVPPPPPPPRTPRGYSARSPRSRGGALATIPSGGYGGGYGTRPPSPPSRPPQGGKGGIMGEVITANLISNAIIQGFQTGVGILQKGMGIAFDAFAERAKDQLEDVAAAGGIYSAAKFGGGKGLPATFQGAMEMQDRINKQMATIASNLPGTTHNYVENSRRLVDTTAQIMSRDLNAFTQLAKDLTGKMNMSAEESFTTVNVEIAKATTLLEKMNPTKTVIPMTQIVEDLLKQEEVSVKGLRKYVAFKRGTTFEAALTRNLAEMNKAGAGTADRLKMIIKVLKEAVPTEMINVFQVSVAGVVEGFKSAFTDPDVGLFGLSRELSFEVTKFDRETGQKIGKEFSNFFKMFSEVFGNLGNLINTAILPGLGALYEPFEGLAKTIEDLREKSFEIFKRQQEYTKYFDSLAAGYGMRREDFKVFEKGGVSVLMDILQGFNMLDNAKYDKIVGKMKQKGSKEEVAKYMKEVYADIIPAIFESPFFKTIGATIGKALADVFKEIAKVMKALLKGDYGVSQFTKAFYEGGGMDAVNEILVYVAEGIGKFLLGVVELYFGALSTSLKSGNFAATGVLGALGLVFGAPAIAGIKIIAKGMNLLVNAFKILLASRVIPVKVKDQGSVITNPNRMLTGTTVAPIPKGPIVPGAAPGPAGGLGAAAARFAGPAVMAASFIVFDEQLLGFAQWMKNQSEKLKAATSFASNGFAVLLAGLGTLLEGLTNTIKGAFDLIVALFTGDIEKVKQSFVRMMNGIAQTIGGLVVSVIGIVTTIGGGIVEAVKNLFIAIWEGVLGIKRDTGDAAGYKPTQGSQSRWNPQTNQTEVLTPDGWKPAVSRAKGGLGDAVASEMKNKPSGSDLVIANSSETVIPAAGGNGMGAFVETLRLGFNAMVSTYRQTQQTQNQTLSKINATLISNQQQTNAKFTTLSAKMNTPSMPGGLGGAAAGGVDAFTPIAQSMGLQMTSGYRPGDPGWHGANRARDFSNGSGPTPQMMQFAQGMASKYGANLKELIYTPLGFSIKNGQQVAPYAQGSHYNHVHVAYANGMGQGVAFNSLRGAQRWENSMVSGSVKVGSVTSNSSEGFGGGSTVIANITINQQSGQNADELASIVALKIGEAVADARASSIFV